MGENEGMEGKDLALKEKKEFEERLLEVVKDLKEGQTTISTEGLEITNSKGNYIIKLKGIPFGIISKDGKFKYNKDNFKQVKSVLEEEGITLEELGLPDVEEWIDIEEQQESKKNEEPEKDEKDLSDDMEEKNKNEPENKKPEKKESEQEKLKKDSKYWQEMDLDREFTTSDTLRKWIKDVLGEAPKRVYRRQTGPHDFEYIGEYNGEYKKLELTTDLEGKNTMQQVYIVTENGKLELEEVDSVLLTKDGRYGIVTKIPDGISTDVTKSFSVTRTNDGNYLATQLIEKQGQNRDPNLPGKDIGDRTNSLKEKTGTIEGKEEIDENNMKISKDGVTIEELGLYEYFKNKGYTPDAIDRMIKDMEENEISADEAESNEKKLNEKNSNKREEGGRGPWAGPANRREH